MTDAGSDANADASANTEPENPHGAIVRTLADTMLRTALPVTVVTIAVAAVVATVLNGTPGLWGALVGGVVALASSLATFVMMKQSADLPVMFVMAVALGGYVFKILALLLVMMLLREVDAFHTLSLALTVLAAVMMWAGAEVVAFKRTKIPTIIPNSQ